MICFFTPINTTGYGIHSYNLMRAYYDEISKEMCLFPISSNIEFFNDYIREWLSNRVGYSKDSPCITIFHEYMLYQLPSRMHIGFPVFELEKFDPVSIKAMESMDFLLTTSEWGKSVLQGNGFSEDRIFVIPEGYDHRIFTFENDIEKKMARITNEGVKFVHVGKMEARKSTTEILGCFVQASEKRNASLLAHIGTPFDKSWFEKVTKFIESKGYAFDSTRNCFFREESRIFIPLGRFQGDNDMAAFYKMADFGVFASKAEGWGLPLIEAIACGTPCITTNWTAQSEYLGNYPDELLLKDYSMQSANDGVWFRGDKGDWRVPDFKKLTAIMESIIEDPRKYLQLAGNCNDSVKGFTWSNAAIKLHEALKTIKAI